MTYQHGISVAIHLVCYSLLYPFWRKISLFTLGFLALVQFFGLDLIILSLARSNASLVSPGLILITCPLLITYLSRHMTFSVGGKKYRGLRQFLLLIETDLKYVTGFFLMSLIINFFFNPLSGLLNYTNLTAVIAFLLSLPFCRKMSKLEERDASGTNG